ncbi:MAG: M20 family metallopeptidase [Candidatus Hydrothermarchaeota archaeon]
MLDIDEEKTIDYMKKLIEIPTENPPGENYREIIQEIQSFLEPYEIKSEIVEVNRKQNLIAKIEGIKEKPTLLLNGHVDVVPPGNGWETDPFQAVIKNKRVYGRGSSDMKGGLAAMISAMESIADSDIEIKGNLIFIASVDEEIGGMDGLGYLMKRNMVNADLCLVGEPTKLDIVTAEKGVLWIRIGVKGKSAHASLPEKGINAIERASSIIKALSEIEYKKSHPLLGKPTINVGKIRGGTKVNVVPDYCEIEIDRRIIPGEDIEEVKKEIIENLKGEECSIEYFLHAKPFEIEKDSEPVLRLKKIIKDITNKEPRIKGIFGFTDARFAYEKGITPIVFGPGSANQAHTANEYVEIEQVINAAKIYALFATDFLNKSRD